jgi:hypothetical protein
MIPNANNKMDKLIIDKLLTKVLTLFSFIYYNN